jgi:group II intron reverse transcriptase/maturase
VSSTFGRQESICCDDNGHYRPELVAAHTGDCESFLHRHALVAHDAVQQGAHQVRSLGAHLLGWIADARNLRLAWDYLAHNGGQAPGPSRRRFADFENQETWEYVRVIGKAIQYGSYRPGPVRRKDIPKGAGRGDRTLTIANIEDRVVARAVVQIIQPLYDPTFDENSFGFRPGRGRQLALAHAMTVTKQQERCVWLVEDLKQAFDRVPHGRLLDVLRMRLPENVVQLIERIIHNDSGRGLPQGSPLSPLLLNIYLDHFLDTRWRQLHPDLPLLRYADDLLILCHTEQEARSARPDLEQLLTPAAMLLKHCEDSVSNLTLGQHAEWLGYQVAHKGRLTVTIAESSWDGLRERLVLAHSKPQSPLRAYSTIRSWILQQAPCYADTDWAQAYVRLVETAKELDFDEIPSRNLVLSRWRRAYARWRRLSRDTGEGDVVRAPQDGGSACHVFPVHSGRGDGASAGAPSPSFSTSGRVTLYTDGCCLRNRVGGWAYLLDADDAENTVERSAGMKRTTNNRAELLAVIHGLEALCTPATVRVVTDSQYVAEGFNKWLALWRAQGWRCGSHKHMRPLENADLWRRFDLLGMKHRVKCDHVRGHAGHPPNERCDHLAREAAERLSRRV